MDRSRFSRWDDAAWRATSLSEIDRIAEESYATLAPEEQADCSLADWREWYLSIWEQSRMPERAELVRSVDNDDIPY